MLLRCAPDPGELLTEAGNLIERMATGKEPAPADWHRLSQDRRSDLLAVRLMVEPGTARLIAQRVMRRLARLQFDSRHT